MLKKQQLQECKSKFDLSYHVDYAQICQDVVGFEQKDGLELNVVSLPGPLISSKLFEQN